MFELRKEGKKQFKKYLNLKIKKFHDFVAIFSSILITLVLILPLLLLLIALFKAYRSNVYIKVILICCGWVLMMICNGLSSVYTLRIIKGYYKELKELEEIDLMSVFIYQITNIPFIFISISLMIVVMFLW